MADIYYQQCSCGFHKDFCRRDHVAGLLVRGGWREKGLIGNLMRVQGKNTGRRWLLASYSMPLNVFT